MRQSSVFIKEKLDILIEKKINKIHTLKTNKKIQDKQIIKWEKYLYGLHW